MLPLYFFHDLQGLVQTPLYIEGRLTGLQNNILRTFYQGLQLFIEQQQAVLRTHVILLTVKMQFGFRIIHARSQCPES